MKIAFLTEDAVQQAIYSKLARQAASISVDVLSDPFDLVTSDHQCVFVHAGSHVGSFNQNIASALLERKIGRKSVRHICVVQSNWHLKTLLCAVEVDLLPVKIEQAINFVWRKNAFFADEKVEAQENLLMAVGAAR